jgi:O-antigen ligase
MLIEKIKSIDSYNFLLIVLFVSLSLPDRVTPIVLILTALFALYKRFQIKRFRSGIFIPFVLLFSYYVLRLMGSVDVSGGIKFIEKNLIYIIGPIVLIPALINQKQRLLKAFVIGFLVVCMYTLVLVFMHYIGTDFEEKKWYFQYIETYGYHPTYMSIYALVSILIIDKYEFFKSPFLNGALIIFNILFIFFTASRAPLLVLFVLLILRTLIFRKKLYVFVFSLALILGFSAYSFSKDFRYKIDQLTTFKGFDYYDNNDYGSVSLRVAKIKAARSVWEEHFWLGYGTGGLKEELIKKYRSKELECWPCSQRKYNPHNQYLSLLSGHGLVGLVLFGIIIAYFIKSCFQHKDYFFFEVLLIFLISGLTESILERQKGVVAFVLLLFLLYVTKNQTNAKSF